MRVWAGLAAVTVLVAGCATPGSPGASPDPVTVEVACPETLVEPTPPEHGLGTNTPAAERPTFPRVGGAWLCTYVSSDTGEEDPDGGALYGWVLADQPREIPEPALVEVEALLSRLEPAEAMRACTADLGPRLMLVIGNGEDLDGVVIDDYGCRDIRLTHDPWTVAPGEADAAGLPAGVLTGPDGIIATLEGLAAAA